MRARFTIDGSANLVQHLSIACTHVRAGVERIIPHSILEGLALAGGYGRGEGGVLRENGRDLPYNDLEFFVFLRGSTFINDHRFKHSLHALGRSLSPALGLEVEFKILSASRLRRSPVSMFYYDLVMGHRWIIGGDSLFAGCDHHRDASRIPLHEATRLLFNRCSGLLFASERLAQDNFTAADADFVGRNLAKAQLAVGDVLLTMAGRYHWSCIERHRRLQNLAESDTLSLAHHAAGVAFKLHPHRSTKSREDLAQDHAELSKLAQHIFLRLESQRLDTKFVIPADYSASSTNKCPEVPLWKNLLIHATTRNIPQRPARYPREHLLHELVALLWTDRDADSHAIRQYADLWSRFN
ncbi:MAG: hypothetical protein B7Z47_00680 [Chthoniobacter sp. 12-60-6]|nr:MAG: hypothetical protein B7Z47_00680 [Chthoniobacter sp. 12-60-6]